MLPWAGLLLPLGWAAAHEDLGVRSFDTRSCPFQTINYVTQSLPQQCLGPDAFTIAFSLPSVDASQAAAASTTPSIAHTTATSTVPAGDDTTIQTSDASALRSSTTSSIGTVSAAPIPSPASPSSSSTLINDASTPSNTVSTEGESDALSDNFLSFEQWKRQQLAQAGQSPEGLASSQDGHQSPDVRRRTSSDKANNMHALDVLGDDAEIELDFGGFGAQPDGTEKIPAARPLPTHVDNEKGQAQPDVKAPRSKDAGKTSKERFNYASFDCAATVLKTNPGSKGASSILVENKDSYMLNKCSDGNKFLVVELCNDILIDTIVLGNFEFFSSTFRHFKVSISDRYPVKSDKWRELGTFEARHARTVQAFVVEDGLIWARYLRIEFLSHHGKEYYCPVSLLRVHGKTMMDDYLSDVKASQGEGEVEDEGTSEEDPPPADMVMAESLKAVNGNRTTVSNPVSNGTAAGFNAKWNSTQLTANLGLCANGPIFELHLLRAGRCVANSSLPREKSSARIDSSYVEPVQSPPTTGPTATTSVSPDNISQTAIEKVTELPSSQTVTRISASLSAGDAGTERNNKPIRHADSSPISPDTSPSPPPSSNKVSVEAPTRSKSSSPTLTASKISATPLGAPASQDSFFKSVHKRLQSLESNATLSMQYIEEQSRLLREALSRAEKRQLNRTSHFLEALNNTARIDLQSLRAQYEQLWQSTVLELAAQREASTREINILGTRLSVLADDILWQRRVAYFQTALVVLCLCLVLFSRINLFGSSSSESLRSLHPSYAFDVPLLQNVLSRSSSRPVRARRRRDVTPASVSGSPGLAQRPASRAGVLSHLRHLTRSPSPSTPESSGSSSDVEEKNSPSPPLRPESPPAHESLPTPAPSVRGDLEDDMQSDDVVDDASTVALLDRASQAASSVSEMSPASLDPDMTRSGDDG